MKKWGEPINLAMVGVVFVFNAYAFASLGAGAYDAAHASIWFQNCLIGVGMALVLALMMRWSISKIEGFSGSLLVCVVLNLYFAFIWFDVDGYRGSGDIRAVELMAFIAIGIGVTLLSLLLHADRFRNRARRRELENMRRARELKSRSRADR